MLHDTPIISALVLGLLTSINPCILATNLAAIGFIGRNIENRRSVFINALLYTLGRAFTYTTLGAVIISLLRRGDTTEVIEAFFHHYGEILLAPILIIIGIVLLDLIRIPLLHRGVSGKCLEARAQSHGGALLLGILLALGFCPETGVLYFVVLMPLAVATPGGYLLPVVFAFATGLPVIVLAWVMAFNFNKIGVWFNRIQLAEKWIRRGVAILFIAMGVYFIVEHFLHLHVH